MSISIRALPPLDKPRLAVVRFAKWAKAEPEQQKVFDAAVATLRNAGAILEELELAELDRTNWNAINTILASEGAAIFADLVARYPDRSSDHLKSLVDNRQGAFRDRLSRCQGGAGQIARRVHR